MDKQAYLEEVYNSALKDELEKIAISSDLQKANKKVMEAIRLRDIEKDYDDAEKAYQKVLRPYAKQRKVWKGSAISGAALGLLAAAPKGKYRIIRGLGGSALGAGAGAAVSNSVLGYLNPNYKKTLNKALDNYYDAEDSISKKYYNN